MTLLLALVAAAAQAEDPKPPDGKLPTAVHAGDLRVSVDRLHAWNNIMPGTEPIHGSRHLFVDLEAVNTGNAEVEFEAPDVWLSVDSKELGDRIQCSAEKGRTRFQVPAGKTAWVRLRAPVNAFPSLRQGAREVQVTIRLKTAAGFKWLQSRAKIGSAI